MKGKTESLITKVIHFKLFSDQFWLQGYQEGLEINHVVSPMWLCLHSHPLPRYARGDINAQRLDTIFKMNLL